VDCPQKGKNLVKTISELAKEKGLTKQGIHYLLDKGEVDFSSTAGQLLSGRTNELTRSEAARQLKSSITSIVRWMAEGKLTGSGKFILKDEKFENFLNELNKSVLKERKRKK